MATELDKLLVKIEADVSDLKKGMKSANDQVKNSATNMGKSFNDLGRKLSDIGGKTLKFGSIFAGVFGAYQIKQVVDVGIQVENLKVRLNALFGSVEEGSRAFEVMIGFASRVPFELSQIQRASGNLAVVTDNAEELNELLEITGNVASITGLSFEQTAEQIQRSFSSGVSSADVFREKGIRNMLGFQAGVEVSLSETKKAFREVFGKGGEFGNATKEFATTLTGTLSMLSDKLLAFRLAISESFFKEIKRQFGDLNKTLEENEATIRKFGRDIGESLAEFTRSVRDNLDEILLGFKALGTFLAGTVVAKLISVLVTMNPIIRAIGISLTALSLGMKRIKQFTDPATKGFDNQDKALTNLNEIYNLATGELRGLEEKQKDVKKSTEELSGLFIDMASIIEGVKETVNEAGESISDAFGKAIVSGEKLGDSLKNIFKSAVAEIISLIFHLTIMKPLLDEINEKLDNTNAKQKNVREDAITNAFIGAFTGGSGGGFMAEGGQVMPNTPYVVGEKGAEMFVPHSAGTIVPNKDMQGSGVNITQNISFSTGIVPTVRAEVLNLLPQIKNETVQAVAESRSRGGSFARTFGA
jgi:hypothetical protein